MNAIHDLIDKDPFFVYTEIYNMRHITIRLKLKIISACLNDQKNIFLHKIDYKTRNSKIYDAAESLDRVILKNKKV
jgi:hypothetical protein